MPLVVNIDPTDPVLARVPSEDGREVTYFGVAGEDSTVTTIHSMSIRESGQEELEAAVIEYDEEGRVTLISDPEGGQLHFTYREDSSLGVLSIPPETADEDAIEVEISAEEIARIRGEAGEQEKRRLRDDAPTIGQTGRILLDCTDAQEGVSAGEARVAVEAYFRRMVPNEEQTRHRLPLRRVPGAIDGQTVPAYSYTVPLTGDEPELSDLSIFVENLDIAGRHVCTANTLLGILGVKQLIVRLVSRNARFVFEARQRAQQLLGLLGAVCGPRFIANNVVPDALLPRASQVEITAGFLGAAQKRWTIRSFEDRPADKVLEGRCYLPDASAECPTEKGASTRNAACVADVGDVGDALEPAPVSYNDPHLITLDGLGYDFQAAGEFVLALSEFEGLQVQSRQRPVASGLQVSMNTAFAFEVGGDVVSVQFDESTNLLVFVNGSESSVQGEQELPDGGSLSVDAGAITVTWSDGSIALIRVRSSFLNLSLALAPRHASRMSGLLGDFDGEADDDLQTREGVQLPIRPPANDLYGLFADSWRVSGENSLFVYFDGESTETFTDRLFPGRVVEVEDLAMNDQAQARAVCEDQGVVDALLLRNCILDTGLSGDPEFAQASGELQETLVPAVTVAEVQGQINTPELACVDPVLVDASGILAPAFEGRYTGTMSNPDGGTDWTAVLDLRQCGVDVTGLLFIESARFGGSAEQYRRVSGEWSEGRLSIELAFPFNFTSVTGLSACRDMMATLEAVNGTLRGPWTATNCPLGGVLDLARSDELGQ